MIEKIRAIPPTKCSTYSCQIYCQQTNLPHTQQLTDLWDLVVVGGKLRSVIFVDRFGEGLGGTKGWR